MNLISLDELYKQYLNYFKENRIHPHPSNLLALLLLPDKDQYLSLTGNLEDFYNYYFEEIDKKIIQVMNDFDLDEEDIMEYAYILGNDNNIDYKKQVFSNGVITLLWGIMFYQDLSSEEIYCLSCSRYLKDNYIEKNTKRLKSRKH